MEKIGFGMDENLRKGLEATEQVSVEKLEAGLKEKQEQDLSGAEKKKEEIWQQIKDEVKRGEASVSDTRGTEEEVAEAKQGGEKGLIKESAEQNEAKYRVTVRRSDGSVEDDWILVPLTRLGEHQEFISVIKSDPDRPGKTMLEVVPRQEVEELSNVRITYDNFGNPTIMRRLFKSQAEEHPGVQTGKSSEETVLAPEKTSTELFEEVQAMAAGQKVVESKVEVTPEQQAEIKKEFETLPAEEQKKVALGLHNIGFYVDEKKNRFFSNIFQGVRTTGLARGMKEKGSLDRFLGALSASAEADADVSQKRFEEADQSKMTKAMSAGTVVGNVAKYGRTISDLFGATLGSPLRYVMMGGMMFGTGASAAKEARFKNEEVLNTTRMQDLDAAAEEAWKIYEHAKTGKETVSKEDLKKAYQANIPKDLLARLEKDPVPEMATGILQRIIKKDVEGSVKKINKEIEEVVQDNNLSEAEKKAKQEKILTKYAKHLNDLDRAVSQFGTVDALALGAKYAETGAKAAVAAMTVETLALSVNKLFEHLPGLLGTVSVEEIETMRTGGRTGGISIEKPAGVFDGITIAGAVEVQKGDTVWSIIDDQLSQGNKGLAYGELGEARQTYIKDYLKDKLVAMSPDELKKIGISSGDIDKLAIGDKVDFSSVLVDEQVAKAFEGAKGLSDEQIASIAQGNRSIAEHLVGEGSELGDRAFDEEFYERLHSQDDGTISDRAFEEDVYGRLRPEAGEVEAQVEIVPGEGMPELFKDIDTTERVNIGKMTVGKLLAETTADKIDKVQLYGSTEGVIDLPPARAHLSEAEYSKYVQIAEQIRDAEPNAREMKMTVDEYVKPSQK